MTWRLGWLVAGSLAFWAAVSYLARLWWGHQAFVYSLVAVALCLVPMAATLLLAQRALRGSPEQQLLVVLGGTGLRMLVVLGAGLALYLLVPYFQEANFWIWILVFYLVTLALETGLMLASCPTAGDSQRR